MSLAMPDRSVPVRRLRCQALICRPFAFFAFALMAGRKFTKNPFRPRARRPRKGIAEEVETGVLRIPAPVRVLAVHDLRLLRVQLQTQSPEPVSDSGRKCRACPSVLQWG